MDSQALQNLMDLLGLKNDDLAKRLGGTAQHYERLKSKKRLPFPVWDALQRLAFREGYCWDAESNLWAKSAEPMPSV